MHGSAMGRFLLVVFAVISLSWLASLRWFSRSQPVVDPQFLVEPSHRLESVTYLSDIEGLKNGELFPLPFAGSHLEGKSLPGRPDEPMPISPEIYDHVDLKVDGKPVGDGPVILQAGSTVHMEGVIHAHPKLDRHVHLGAGLGLATRANNKHGWMIRWFKFFGGPCREGRRMFDVDYVVPDEPGEYTLVVLSYAQVGLPLEVPGLLAAQYDAVIENRSWTK